MAPDTILPITAIKTAAAAMSLIVLIAGWISLVMVSQRYSIAVLTISKASTNIEQPMMKSHSIALSFTILPATITNNNTSK